MPFVESSNLLTRRNVGVVLYHLYYKCIEYCSSYGIVGCCSCVCCPIKKGGRQCSLIRRTNKKCLFSCRRNRIYQQLSTTHSLTGRTATSPVCIFKDQCLCCPSTSTSLVTKGRRCKALKPDIIQLENGTV